MPRLSSLTVPLAEYSRTHRRSRSTDDQSIASIRTPTITAPSKSFEPGDSWSHPITLCTDEDEDHYNLTPIARTPRKTTARNGTASPLPGSAKSSHIQPPTTPIHARSEVHRVPASDPGPRVQGKGYEIYERTLAYQHLDQLPCGRKQYTYPLGMWSRAHQADCTQCITQQGQYRELYETETQQLTDERDEPTPRRSTPTKTLHGDGDGSDNVFDNKTPAAGEANEKTVAGRHPDEMAPMVHHRLIHAAKTKLTGDEKQGYLYIFRHLEKPGLLKLGFSQEVQQRGKQHKSTCKLEPVWVMITDGVEKMRRAEKLAKLDMDHVRTDWMCTSCSQNHTEWFQISEENAKAVVRRWVTWINKQAPYDGRGDLSPIWSWLMDYRRVPRLDFANDDHDARWAHWDKVLARPSRQARAGYKEYAELQPRFQQPSREEKPLVYRQHAAKDHRDGVVRHGRTLVEQAISKAMDIKRDGDVPAITIVTLHVHNSVVNIGAALSLS